MIDKKSALFCLIAAFFALGLYILFFLIPKIILNNILFLNQYISWKADFMALMVFLLISSFIDLEKRLSTHNKRYLFALFISFTFAFGYLGILMVKRQEYDPKIYKVSRRWVIQAQEIIISGENFGLSHEKGEVMAGKTNFLVKYWSDEEIVVETPVPGEFGKMKLRVRTKAGKASNSRQVEIRNPIGLPF